MIEGNNIKRRVLNYGSPPNIATTIDNGKTEHCNTPKMFRDAY
jgi:hypothetical protein